MGKFATYSKRGSAASFGSMLAPVAGDWTFTSPGTAQYSFNRISAIPAPAVKWGGRLRTVGGVWASTAVQAATPITGGAVSASTQEGQIAWFDNGGGQLSPWSDIKTVVIL